MAKTIIVGKFNETGGNTININLVVSRWNHLWLISQYGAKFTLIKGVRKDSDLRQIKTQISATQANELIQKLGLKQMKSQIFTKGSTWRTYENNGQ